MLGDRISFVVDGRCLVDLPKRRSSGRADVVGDAKQMPNRLVTRIGIGWREHSPEFDNRLIGSRALPVHGVSIDPCDYPGRSRNRQDSRAVQTLRSDSSLITISKLDIVRPT